MLHCLANCLTICSLVPVREEVRRFHPEVHNLVVHLSQVAVAHPSNPTDWFYYSHKQLLALPERLYFLFSFSLLMPFSFAISNK